MTTSGDVTDMGTEVVDDAVAKRYNLMYKRALTGDPTYVAAFQQALKEFPLMDMARFGAEEDPQWQYADASVPKMGKIPQDRIVSVQAANLATAILAKFGTSELLVRKP